MAEYGSLPFAEQIDFLRSKVDVPTERWDDLLGAAHDRAFVVAGATGADLLADLHAAVLKGVEQGTTLAEFRHDFDQIVKARGWVGWTGSDTPEGVAWRTRVIYETNLRTSYAAGRWQQIQAVKADRPYLEYRHSDSVLSPRPLHLSWDGLVLPVDDPWWQTHYPPNGWGCKCRVFALGAGDLAKLGKPGPDQAPDDGTYEWTSRNTGEVTRVPAGIDPGWDYAPGASLDAGWVERKAATLPPPIADDFREAMAAGPPTRPAYPLPTYTPATTTAEAKRAAQAILDAPGPVPYPTHPDGRPLIRFRHLGTRDPAADRIGRANGYALPPDLGNLVNAAMVEMAAEADRLGIPRLRGVTSTVSRSAAAEMGDGVLGVSKSNSAATGPASGQASGVTVREWAAANVANAERAIELGQRWDNPAHVAAWTAKRTEYQAIIDRLDAGETDDQVMAGQVSQWRLGDDPAQRPANVREYFWRAADQTRKTLWHEFGHHIHQTHGVTDAVSYRNPGLERRLEALFRTVKDGPSDYSRSNPREWFAECFACWKMGRPDLVPAPVADLIRSLYPPEA